MFLMPGASIPAYGTCRTRCQDILSVRVSDSVFLVHARLVIEAWTVNRHQIALPTVADVRMFFCDYATSFI
jgi:hypothetical protein